MLLTRWQPETRTIPWRGVFIAALTVIVSLTAVKTISKALKPGRTGELSRTAFLRWRPQILALQSGADIYREFNYPNPPVMALILTPLAMLAPIPGLALWFALKVLMALAIAHWVFRLIESRGPPMSDGAKAFAVILSLHPVLGDLSHGNVNLFIAFLIAFGLDCYRREKDWIAGLSMALAIACKVTPALFVPYFLWKRAWKTLAGLGLGLVLWLGLLPGVLLGFDANRQLLTSWFEVMVKPFAMDGKITSEHANQSLPGLLTRLFTANPSFIEYSEEDGQPMAADTHTLIDLGPGAVNAMVKAVMAAFALFFVMRPFSPARGGRVFAAECGLILLGMLLFSERTWKHHATTLLLPLAVIACVRGSWPVLTAAAFLSLVPSALGEDAQDLAMVYGVYTVLYLVLAVTCVSIIRGASTVAEAERHSGSLS